MVHPSNRTLVRVLRLGGAGWFLVRLQQFPDLGHFSASRPTRNAVSVALFWAACTSTWASSCGFFALVVCQMELCGSLHRLVGMTLPLVGHQFPRVQLAGSSDLGLVVDCLGLLLQQQHLEIRWHLSFLPRHTMLSGGNRASQMIQKSGSVVVMFVGIPGVVLWCSHLTVLWPGIINRHSLLFPKNLIVVLLRSVKC